VRTLPGIGPVLGAVLVAEIGDITRFASADKLTCWAGMTPKHHESDTKVHCGADHEARIETGPLGCRRVRPTTIENDLPRMFSRSGR
jgi:hypothetical protein